MMKLTPFQWSSFNFFGFYCAFGVLLPFLPVWLKYHGYDTEQIGLLIALGYLFRFVGAMFFSRRVNNPNQLIPLNRFLTWATVGAVLLMMWAVPSIWLFLPVIALFHIFNGGSMPIADTIAATWHQQIGLDYGRTRLFGSIAFVVGSISTGYLVGWLGQNAIIGILMGWLVFLGTGILFSPTQKFKYVEKPLNNNRDEMGYWQLLRVLTTLRMLVAISLIQASHAVYYAYSTLYWTSNGISTENTSLLWAVAVAGEITFFFFANKLCKAWRTHYLIMLSALGAVIRWSLLASTNSFIILVLAQLLHAISYGMGHYAMIRYIATQPVAYTAKLQALYFSIASCVVMALFTFMAGQLYQFSPVWSFGLMAILAFPALFIVPKRFESRIE
ncbi:3-phenylpropionic acid transporter [Vespertiliibacter pulmonis]|uniref:PPP family 3-phenylpropionic acid transporter n=1 Tax=Vespertiliibacter pulmonis TaxID=1443036 RepID=A0A3N4WJN7_9PAST|nr:3-phenylpropionate MFS transporter [Vespertiliibacter pulmonis]QLB20178.1 3-phenylpropionic acid transporter [Vespertiliibacter pulmonis]RPE86150.1 PPP family 3-phenylpropionic acid transporter [Vespertiliibacter pulmonis]